MSIKKLFGGGKKSRKADPFPVSSGEETQNNPIKAFITADENGKSVLSVFCSAGLQCVTVQDQITDDSQTSLPLTKWTMNLDGFENDKVEVIVESIDGETREIENAWNLKGNRPAIAVPGTGFTFERESLRAQRHDPDEDEAWSLLFVAKADDGSFQRATSVDIRVGGALDGAIVCYENGMVRNCGAVESNGEPHVFGGESEEHELPLGTEIAKVEVMNSDLNELGGIRMYLSNGKAWGELNRDEDDSEQTIRTLKPNDGDRIVGFFGHSGSDGGYVTEFGIITAPRAEEIPDLVYNMPEIQSAPLIPAVQREWDEQSDGSDGSDAEESEY